jgi:hypothetical protein
MLRDHLEPVRTRPLLHKRSSLRIGMVAPASLAVPPAGYGGIERVVSVLTEGLVAAGHDVTLFACVGSVTSAHLVTPLERPPTLGDPASVTDDLYTAPPPSSTPMSSMSCTITRGWVRLSGPRWP